MHNIKIGIVTPSFPPQDGGIATAHYNLFHLLKDHYDVRVFAYNDDRPSEDIRIIKRKSPGFFSEILLFFFKLYFFKHRKEPFPNCMCILKYAYGAFLVNKPIKRFYPDFLIVPDNYVPLYWIKKTSAKNIVWFSHHSYFRFRDNPFIQGRNYNDNDIARSLERKALKKASLVICPSNYMKQVFYEAYSHNVPLHLIRNFVDEELISSIEQTSVRSILGIQVEVPVIYLPSAGSEIKGKRYTFEIIRRLSNQLNNKIAFYLSGFIPEDLMAEINSIKGIQIYAPGHVPWNTNVSLVKSCDLCIYPTLIENFSLALVEVQTLRIPVVTFDTGGNKEIVVDQQTGYIVPFLDIESLIGKSLQLIENTFLLTEMKINSGKYSRLFFKKEVILEEYRKLFQSQRS